MFPIKKKFSKEYEEIVCTRDMKGDGKKQIKDKDRLKNNTPAFENKMINPKNRERVMLPTDPLHSHECQTKGSKLEFTITSLKKAIIFSTTRMELPVQGKAVYAMVD